MMKWGIAQRVLLASVIGNTAICGLKLAGGIVSGSTALLADGSDSLLNVVSGAIAYKFKAGAEKPPDSKHHYGHSLLEIYGSLLILILMIFTLSFIAFIAVQKLIHGYVERIDPIGVPFAATSLTLNLTMSILLRTFGRESAIMKTEARHMGLDVIEGSLTLSGVTLGAYVSAFFDIAATFILLGLISFFVFQTLRGLRVSIMAESPPEDVIKSLEEALLSVDGVKGIHDLRARQAGARIFADVHLEVDKMITVEEAHRICDEAESKIKQLMNNIDIVIHVEPGEEGVPQSKSAPAQRKQEVP